MLAIDERLKRLQEREAARQSAIQRGLIRIIHEEPAEPDKRSTEQQTEQKTPER